MCITHVVFKDKMSLDMRFPTKWYVKQAKPQISLRIYAQSDQSHCLLLEYSMSVKLLTEQHLEFLSLKGECTGLWESKLVKMPHCWRSHVMAQIFECTHQWDVQHSLV